MGELRGEAGGGDRRGALPDAVARRILRRILDGGLIAGERLPPERELALELGINRSSVREALKKLEQLRVVETQRGSGTRVRDPRQASLELVREASFPGGRPDEAWLRDLLGVREMLFPALVRAMIETAPPDRLDSSAALVRGAASSELSDSEFVESLGALPATLCELGGNRVALILGNSLERFLEADQSRSPRADEGGGRIKPDRRALTPVLRRLAVTLEARDVDSAERCARDLVRRLNLLTHKRLCAPVGEVDPRSAPR